MQIKEFFQQIQSDGQGMQTRSLDDLPNMTIDELKEVTSLSVYDISINKLRDKKKKIIWHVAMPKSGSTWVCNVISDYLQKYDWKSSWPHLVGDRPQEISLSEFYRQRLLDDNVFICHMHSLGSQYNIDLARDFNIKILLQVRNIPDALVSLLDHFDDADDLMPPVVYTKKEIWNNYSQQQKIDFILNFAAPWYIREAAIKWSAAPDMTPQTVLYRRPVAQFSNFQPKIVSSWLILALFQANFLISGRSRLCPYQLVNSNQVRQGE